MTQVAYQAGAYPGLCSMKQLGVFLTPPPPPPPIVPWEEMLVHGRVIPSIFGHQCPFIHLGGECLALEQQNEPDQGRNQGCNVIP